METVLITGGTGLVGRRLCERLKEEGFEVAILSRTPEQGSTTQTYVWDVSKMEIEKEAIKKADYIIHLAGVNIGGKRWTARRKQDIIDSRVKTGQLIYEKIKEQNSNLKAFVSASAIGYYGAVTSDRIFAETDLPSDDFLGTICQKWEQMADSFENSGIRTVKVRIGVVLTRQGGALSKIATPVKLGIGSPIGTGRQYMPWIHIDDLCNIFIKAITDTQMKGAYNAVAPDHLTNREFTRVLAHILKKQLWMPNIPTFVIKTVFGEMSAIVLKGSRVSADKIIAAGYSFLFPDLETALADLTDK